MKKLLYTTLLAGALCASCAEVQTIGSYSGNSNESIDLNHLPLGWSLHWRCIASSQVYPLSIRISYPGGGHQDEMIADAACNNGISSGDYSSSFVSLAATIIVRSNGGWAIDIQK